MENLVETLGITPLSRSQVSVMAKELPEPGLLSLNLLLGNQGNQGQKMSRINCLDDTQPGVEPRQLSSVNTDPSLDGDAESSPVARPIRVDKFKIRLDQSSHVCGQLLAVVFLVEK